MIPPCTNHWCVQLYILSLRRILSKMSKWAKLSELDSCFFAKACLSWSKLHSCTDMSRAFSEPRLSNFAHLSDSWVIQEYFVCDGSLSRLYFTKKKSLIGSLYRLGGSIRFGYCAIPCFGGLCEERLPCYYRAYQLLYPWLTVYFFFNIAILPIGQIQFLD